ncbi:kinase-like domain-containing protein, partial [Cladochytrium replicatum]
MADALAPSANSRRPSGGQIIVDSGSPSPGSRRPSGGNTDVSQALSALQIPGRNNNGQSRGTLSSSTREASVARSNSPSGSQNRLALYLDRYTVTKVLGEGSYGKVKLAIDSQTGEKVALKVFQKATVKKLVHITRIKREVYVMRLLHHPNIIKLYDVVETEKEIVLSMEYVNGGELFDYIVTQRRVKEKTARRFFRQIVSALDYCHKSSIIHRDLKPENLLLDQERNIRIIDFGFVNLFDQDDVMKTFCGSPYYASPEMIGSKNYVGPEVDIWSLGVILFALLAGHLPFRDQNTAELYRKIATGSYECPDYFSKESRDLIARMLVVDPFRRASIDEIKMHPWTLDGHDGPPENLIPTRPKFLPGDENTLNPDTIA